MFCFFFMYTYLVYSITYIGGILQLQYFQTGCSQHYFGRCLWHWYTTVTSLTRSEAQDAESDDEMDGGSGGALFGSASLRF